MVKPSKKRAKNPNGRPPHKPTDEGRKSVEAMAGYGIPHVDIATVVGVSHNTLRKRYRAELDAGHIKANSKIAESLYQQAVDHGNVTAAIWWTKARMGWSETMKHTGEDGGPITVILKGDDAKL